jgi:transketolase
MRNAFADELTKLGAEDPRVMLLSGDIGNQLFDGFKNVAPGRFINCGIGEANMMGMAAGLAMNGLRPIVYTITPFTTTRCFEQIRVDVCYHRVPVAIVGTGSGISYADLGPTHHSLEDLAILRTLPGMTVVAPADSTELRLGMRAALKQDGPVYMRIGKKGEPNLHSSDPDFKLGRAITLREGDDVCLIGTGTLTANLLKAADFLAAKRVSARVESFHTVKPLDEERLEEIFARYRLVGIAEEHGRIGGLAGAIAEWCIAHQNAPYPRVISFGAPDEFAHVIGSQDYFRHKFGLSAEAIAHAIGKAV